MRLQPYYSIGKNITANLDYLFDECINDNREVCKNFATIIIQYRFVFSVVYQLIVVYLPNTSSTNSPDTNTQSSDTSNMSTSRSTMQNPCRGRVRPRSEGLSTGDQQFLSTSLWKKCLVECHFSPSEEADALVQLVTQTGELQETFNSFKNR